MVGNGMLVAFLYRSDGGNDGDNRNGGDGDMVWLVMVDMEDNSWRRKQ